MTTLLSPRQEAFCRHFVVSGNAADAARRAGYSDATDRQIGYENLTKPYILARIGELRAIAEDTRRREAALLLAPLEKALRQAEAAGDYRAVIRIVALQAQLTGLTGRRSALADMDMAERPGAPGPIERVSASCAALSRSGQAGSRHDPGTDLRRYLVNRRPDALDRLALEDPPHPQLTGAAAAAPLSPAATDIDCHGDSQAAERHA